MSLLDLDINSPLNENIHNLAYYFNFIIDETGIIYTAIKIVR